MGFFLGSSFIDFWNPVLLNVRKSIQFQRFEGERDDYEGGKFGV